MDRSSWHSRKPTKENATARRLRIGTGHVSGTSPSTAVTSASTDHGSNRSVHLGAGAGDDHSTSGSVTDDSTRTADGSSSDIAQLSRTPSVR